MADNVVRGEGDVALLEHTLSFLDPADIALSALRVSHFWHDAALSDAIWAEKCDRLWRDKVFVPAKFRREAPEPLRRIEAYWRSLEDSRRTHLTEEELCALQWHSRMKGWAGSSWTETDPWWQGQPAAVRSFAPDGTTDSEKGSGRWKFVPDSCGKSGPLGSFVRLSRGGRSFPTHFVSRWAENWGWVLQNCWGFAASFPLPPLGSEPALEDDGEVCQRCTVESCSDEAQRFNLGLPLPHDDPPEGAEEAEAGGLPVAFAWVMINGERVQVPISVLLALMQRATTEEDEEDGRDGDGSGSGAGGAAASSSALHEIEEAQYDGRDEEGGAPDAPDAPPLDTSV